MLRGYGRQHLTSGSRILSEGGGGGGGANKFGQNFADIVQCSRVNEVGPNLPGISFLQIYRW